MSVRREAPTGIAPWLAFALCLGACASPEREPLPAAKTLPAAETALAVEAPVAVEASAASELVGPEPAPAASEHYVIVTTADDPGLVEEASLRLAATRARLATEFPPREPGTAAESDAPCTVRICPDRAGYVESGGPPGSSCFFDAVRREMVLFDDRGEALGDARTWSSLQHIAVHEYFAEVLDLDLERVPPWLLYGTAAVYAGMECSGGRLRLDPDDPKFAELGRLLAERSALPLAVLLAFDRAEFYGANGYDSGGRRNLVLAWSFALFLRTGSEECAEWRASWSGLAPRVARALQAGRANEQALDEGLAGANLEALDRAWRSWIEARARR